MLRLVHGVATICYYTDHTCTVMLCAVKFGPLSTKLSCGHGKYSPLLVGSYKSKSLIPSPTLLSQSHIHINIGLDVCHQTHVPLKH